MSMNPHITVLKDRILLGDGRSVIEPELVVDYFLRGLKPSDVLVTEDTWEVSEFNLRSDEQLEIFNDQEVKLKFDWLIPQEYLDLDLTEYFMALLDKDNDRALIRVENELAEVKARGFENGMRTIIYVVDTLKQQKQIWGVGRGSSCASYLLYLIGLHCVDCLKYDIHFSEFYHD